MASNLNPTKKSVNFINEFRGYNHQAVIAENEFYDENNMSCAEYPILRTREKRNKTFLTKYQHIDPSTSYEATDKTYIRDICTFKLDIDVPAKSNVVFNNLYPISFEFTDISGEKHTVELGDGTMLDSYPEYYTEEEIHITKYVCKSNVLTQISDRTYNPIISYKMGEEGWYRYRFRGKSLGSDNYYEYAGANRKVVFRWDRRSLGTAEFNVNQIDAESQGNQAEIKSIIKDDAFNGGYLVNAQSFWIYDYYEFFPAMIETGVDNWPYVIDFWAIQNGELRDLPYRETYTGFYVEEFEYSSEDFFVDVYDKKDLGEIEIVSNEKIGYLMNGTLYYDGIEVPDFGEKNKNNRMVSAGEKIVSFPMKKVYDIARNTVENIDLKYECEISGYRTDGIFDKLYIPKYKEYYDENNKIVRNDGDGFKSDNVVVSPTKTIKKGDDFTEYEYMCSTRQVIYETSNDISCVSYVPNLEDENFEVVDAWFYSMSQVRAKLEKGNVENPTYSSVIFVAYRLKAKKKLTKGKKYKFLTPRIEIVDTNISEDTPYLTISMCDEDKNDIQINFKQNIEPTADEVKQILDNGQTDVYWIDTSVEPSIIKQYSPSYQTWAQKMSAYYVFRLHNVADIPCSDTSDDRYDELKDITGFKEYDNVTIECGLDDIDSEGYEIKEVSEDYVVVNIVLPQALYESGIKYFRMHRKCPDIDFCCERDNRIWGCSVNDNEIYASALGDPTNWNQFQDLTTDSYALKVGSEGKFTGCYNYLSNVLFFKENYIHKIFGTKPSNFYLQTIKTEGVAEDAWDSIALVRDTLYFKSKYGIYAYNGSVPVLISDNFGLDKYYGGHAAHWKDRYFISFDRACFSYDTKDGIWHKEDPAGFVSNMVSHYLDMYYIKREGDNCYLYRSEPFDEDNISEEDLEWFFETGDLQINSPYQKYVGRILVRCTLEKDAYFDIEISYDEEEYKAIYHQEGEVKLKTLVVPIVPRRCDHIRMRFSGKGNIRIYSISKEVEEGGEN